MWCAKEDNNKGTCNNGRAQLECEGWEGRGGVGGEGEGVDTMGRMVGGKLCPMKYPRFD